MTLALVLTCVVAYFIGGIPFGVLAARTKGIDIFKFGSGNPGATNVARALGKEWGIAVFVLDILKGVVPAVGARFVSPGDVGFLHAQAVWFAVGLCAVAGHCASPFLRFRGGKGVATSLGAGLGASPIVALSAFGIFLAVFVVTRYVSLASIVAVIAATLFGWLIPGQAPELAIVYLCLSIFVIYRHRANIRRLLDGKEPKFTFKKPPPSEETASRDDDKEIDSEEADPTDGKPSE